MRVKDVKKVVLAYSGGLDTSVILRWLQTTYNCEVVTFTADLGQGEELAPAREKALKILIETAAPRCDAATLRRLRLLLDDASPLLTLAIEDCAEGAAREAAGRHSPGTRRAVARALQRACIAALLRIPPIDHLPTREAAKQALRAVAALERLALTLIGNEELARDRAA